MMRSTSSSVLGGITWSKSLEAAFRLAAAAEGGTGGAGDGDGVGDDCVADGDGEGDIFTEEEDDEGVGEDCGNEVGMTLVDGDGDDDVMGGSAGRES